MAIEYLYNSFPPKIEQDKEIFKLVSEARTELGRYDGFLSSMLNSDILLSPLFLKEAVLSSKIEGTQSTLTEVLEFESDTSKQKNLSQEKGLDIKEILNYRYALAVAIKLLKKYPLSQKVLKDSHKVLMKGVRGGTNLGEYRKVPVWIGPNKSDIKVARFIPITADKIPSAMSSLEKFLHYSNEYDDLIKIAVLHAEFEAIHPFLDGNGRLGRMLIPLYLADKKLLSSPSFYISQYFEKNRESYYDLLLEVSKSNDWLSWCKFFIKGIIEQSQDNFKRAKAINNYYRELKEKIPRITKSQYGIAALDFIFKKNYFSSPVFYKDSKIPKQTAVRLLNVLEKEKILHCVHGLGRNPNFYVFKKLIDIADGK